MTNRLMTMARQWRWPNYLLILSLGVNLIIGVYRQVISESKTFEITGAGEKFLKVARFFQFPALFNIKSKEPTT